MENGLWLFVDGPLVGLAIVEGGTELTDDLKMIKKLGRTGRQIAMYVWAVRRPRDLLCGDDGRGCSMKTWQKYAAEVFGTFMLVGIGTGAILGIKEAGEPVIIGVSLAFGLALITALYSLARVSGGHFNPVVTLAMFLDRRIGWTDSVGYVISQALGAFLASGVLAIVLSRADVAATATQVSAAISQFEGFVAEAVFTLIFVFAILVLSKSKSHTKFLGMGAALAAVHMLGISFTGASVNPARSFAPALVGDAWSGFWVYVVGPALGAVIAWFLYKVIVQGDTDFTDDYTEIKGAAITT